MVRSCKEKDCLRKYYAKGMCKRHYKQMLRTGVTKKRAVTDPNEFVLEGDVCIISIFNNKSEKVAETIIDAEDYEKCKLYKWCIAGGYVYNNKAGKMSVFILGVKTNSVVVGDHIDGNTLNNRKNNLQVITNQQNIIKRKKNLNNKTGYRGVFIEGKGWISKIGFNGKKYYLGRFSNIEEAAQAYNEKAKELFGRFAVLNKIENKSLKMVNFS
jgi:hypothetical protein